VAKTGTEAPKAPLLPSVAAYSLIGVAVCVVIVATVLIARKVKAINDIW
jgi:hypothetical protein